MGNGSVGEGEFKGPTTAFLDLLYRRKEDESVVLVHGKTIRKIVRKNAGKYVVQIQKVSEFQLFRYLHLRKVVGQRELPGKILQGIAGEYHERSLQEAHVAVGVWTKTCN